jgi:F-type H+-transporting ATPase subunit a
MLPYGFTITGHLFVTFLIAFSFNLSFIFKGFSENGLTFLNIFVPSGAPKMLLPLIIAIEVVSYLIRTFSLSIRLFANMMAGHCLLFVVSSFVLSLLATSYISVLLLIFVYVFIFILEFAIAFLQAYVFTILLCIYLHDSLHPGH